MLLQTCLLVTQDSLDTRKCSHAPAKARQRAPVAPSPAGRQPCSARRRAALAPTPPIGSPARLVRAVALFSIPPVRCSGAP